MEHFNVTPSCFPILDSSKEPNILMCLDLSVGLHELTMVMADSFSSYIGVGPSWVNPSSDITDLIYLAVFAAVTAAISSASVELGVTMDCALDLYYTMAPSENVKA